MKYLFALLLFLPTLSFAEAAPNQLIASYSAGNFLWTWAPGAPPLNSPPDGFVIKCATPPSTVPTITKAIPDPTARKFPISQVLPSAGEYSCTINAYNTFGGSADSNRIFFLTGDVPSSPTGFGIDAVQP